MQTTPDAAPATATQFDPATACTIRGRVTWTGAIPIVPPFEVWSIPLADDGSREKRLEPNPNAPVIDRDTRGIVNAVVFLRGMDLRQAKLWDLPPVRVEQRDRQCHVLQGGVDSRIGFVRRRDRIEMVSRDPVFHALHADGAAYFSLAFPDPDSPCSRRLTEKGIVELTSAAGRYAMRAYLFVDDHPYYARTDTTGRFVLEGVPPGRYEVVCWLPNPVKERHERDPETAVISRWFFRPPVEQARPIQLDANDARELSFSFSSQSFQRSSDPPSPAR